MSELATVHPYDPAFVARYVAAVRGELAAEALLASEARWVGREMERARLGYARALSGNETGANAVSYGLARMLGAAEPVFFLPWLGLTDLEAKFDRGMGMLLRPPSRLFGEAGLETAAARAMPIRIDAGAGLMGGAYIPPALTPRFHELLDQRLERLARRIAEAEMDAPALLGALLAAAAYATKRGYGLYEAVDVFVPDVPESAPPGLRPIVPDRKTLDRELRRRLEEASRPPKEPGLLTRLFRRGGPRAQDPDAGRRWRGMNDVTPPPEPLADDAPGADRP